MVSLKLTASWNYHAVCEPKVAPCGAIFICVRTGRDNEATSGRTRDVRFFRLQERPNSGDRTVRLWAENGKSVDALHVLCRG